MANASHFQRGSGVYKCQSCGHNTRSTGRGDNEHSKLCVLCYDLAGEANSLSDNGELYESRVNVQQMMARLDAQSGAGTAEREFNEIHRHLQTVLAGPVSPKEPKK